MRSKLGPPGALAVLAAALLSAGGALAQGAPLGGSISITLSPSTTSPAVGSTFTVDLGIDMSGATGTCAAGGAAVPFALGAASIGLAFDTKRLELVAAAPCAGAPPALTVTCHAIAGGANCLAASKASGAELVGALCAATLTLRNLGATPAAPARIATAHAPSPRGIVSNSITEPAACGGPVKFPDDAITDAVVASVAAPGAAP